MLKFIQFSHLKHTVMQLQLAITMDIVILWIMERVNVILHIMDLIVQPLQENQVFSITLYSLTCQLFHLFSWLFRLFKMADFDITWIFLGVHNLIKMAALVFFKKNKIWKKIINAPKFGCQIQFWKKSY